MGRGGQLNLDSFINAQGATALTVFIAFVALLRGKGLLGVSARGVTWL